MNGPADYFKGVSAVSISASLLKSMGDHFEDGFLGEWPSLRCNWARIWSAFIGFKEEYQQARAGSNA
jgi:hypothetical protein